MAIVIDKKIYRNIQEQVEKNKRDIAAWTNIQFTLNTFGITVLGRVDAEADIPEGTYSYGDAYLVGEEEPYDIYIFTRDGESGEFINMGPLSIVGPQGAKGDQGDAGTITVGSVTAGDPGTNPIVTNSGTNQNAILNFVIPRGLTGATGAQGNVGPKGDTGERGPIGLTGPQGDPGQSFMIIATITNTSQLPDPTETPRNYAYVYKDGDQLTPDLIYFITGEVGSEVWSYASFAQTGTTVSVNGNPVSTFDADTKQDKIDSSHKLSSDLVDDDNATNKFVTAVEKSQITTNKNDITALKNQMLNVDGPTWVGTLTDAQMALLMASPKPILCYVNHYFAPIGQLNYEEEPEKYYFIELNKPSSSGWASAIVVNTTLKTKTYTSIQLDVISSLTNAINAKYTKPSSGIPASDLASAVQTSLGKADTAVQPSALLDLIYPVGSIYTSVNNTSPATLFGGTWVALNSGNTIKLPKGDINVNAKSTHHATAGSSLHFTAFSGTIANGTAIGLWDGDANKTTTATAFPSGSTGITPDNLVAETSTNAEEVYMWKRTA